MTEPATLYPPTALARQSEASAILHMVERVARDPTVNLDVLERLMAMRDRVIADERRKAFDRAIGLAKAEMPEIKKNRTVSYGPGKTAYQYEDLAEIERTIVPVLSKHGLKYRFRSDGVTKPGTIIVTCILSHDDGHAEENSLPGPVDTTGSKNAVQAIGSTVTYLQRYTLKCALGLAASPDDDGNAAGKAETVSEEQAQQITTLVAETKTNVSVFLRYADAPSISDIPAKKAAELIAQLTKKKRAQEQQS